MKSLENRIRTTVENWQMLPAAPTTLILMVSGGADSVALTYLMTRLYPENTYHILHVNHNLRGSESDADEAFVRQLAEELAIPCQVRQIDLAGLQNERGGNLEELGREMRYSLAAELVEALEASDDCSGAGLAGSGVSAGLADLNTSAAADPSACSSLTDLNTSAGHPSSNNSAVANSNAGAGHVDPNTSATDNPTSAMAESGTSTKPVLIVTAHTANDSVETFLMRVIKGGGADSWSGIPPLRNNIIRPLIDITHAELTAWLTEQKLEWREDTSNYDTHYLRAFVRHQLIPLIQSQNPKLVETINRSLKVLSAESDYLATQAQPYLDDPLAAPDLSLIRRALRQAYKNAGGETRALTFELTEAMRLQGQTPGFALDLPGGITARTSSEAKLGFYSRNNLQGAVPSSNPGNHPGSNPGAGFSTGSDYPAEHHSFHATLTLDTPLQTPLGTITMTEIDRQSFGQDAESYARSVASQQHLVIDADALLAASIKDSQPTLQVSSLQAGDWFSPLGMPGKHKKVSDLLIDRKIDRHKRAACLKLMDGDRIVWIIGVQADDRFKVKPESRRLLSIIIRFN
ncbi:MAG: tRNA lysidine(34) synthetase TilS [Coriobacteriales bacterium]|jgi:tRNA(Ile)-lysidine synthase|nr:tRNA lysidine(34) synthetase TilS [Coriobacteriales bacterium]